MVPCSFRPVYNVSARYAQGEMVVVTNFTHACEHAVPIPTQLRFRGFKQTLPGIVLRL